MRGRVYLWGGAHECQPSKAVPRTAPNSLKLHLALVLQAGSGCSPCCLQSTAKGIALITVPRVSQDATLGTEMNPHLVDARKYVNPVSPLRAAGFTPYDQPKVSKGRVPNVIKKSHCLFQRPCDQRFWTSPVCVVSATTARRGGPRSATSIGRLSW